MRKIRQFNALFVTLLLVIVFQNCTGSERLPSSKIATQVGTPSETVAVVPTTGGSREVQRVPAVNLKPGGFTVVVKSAAVEHQALHGVALETRYRRLVSSIGLGELVQRFIEKSHPNYASRQLSKANSIDPRMACATDLVADGKHPRGKYSEDFSDIAPRALLTEQGGKKKFVLFGGHINPFNMVGASSHKIARDCAAPVYRSQVDRLYTHHRSYEWISNVYTRNGKNVYAFANNDWRACVEMSTKPKGCDDAVDGYAKDANKWWWASFTSLISGNGGKSFKSPSANPTDYVIAKPGNAELQKVVEHSKFFNPSGITGFYQSSNILRSPLDGAYYFMTKRQTKAERGASDKGFCVFRAPPGAALEKSGSWKTHSTAGTFSGDPAKGECRLLNPRFLLQDGQEVTLIEARHISYNMALGRFIALGMARVKKDGGARTATSLVLVSTKDPQFLTWDSEGRELFETRVCASGPCPDSLDELANGDRVYEIKYANLIDPSYEKITTASTFKQLVVASQGQAQAARDAAERKNFDVTGAKPWLYFSYKDGTKVPGGVRMDSLEIVRIPIEISP